MTVWLSTNAIKDSTTLVYMYYGGAQANVQSPYKVWTYYESFDQADAMWWSPDITFYSSPEINIISSPVHSAPKALRIGATENDGLCTADVYVYGAHSLEIQNGGLKRVGVYAATNGGCSNDCKQTLRFFLKTNGNYTEVMNHAHTGTLKNFEVSHNFPNGGGYQWKSGLHIENACNGSHYSYWDDLYVGPKLAVDPVVTFLTSGIFSACQ